MATLMPTQPGDVLILRTMSSFRSHAVGLVVRTAQQDFRGQLTTSHIADLAEAVARARALVTSGGQIYLRNLDTDDWSDVPAVDVNERRTA